MKRVSFFVDTIKIIPHSATNGNHLSRPVSIREFADGEPVRLLETENGELLCEKGAGGTPGYKFIEGPEAA